MVKGKKTTSTNFIMKQNQINCLDNDCSLSVDRKYWTSDISIPKNTNMIIIELIDIKIETELNHRFYSTILVILITNT